MKEGQIAGVLTPILAQFGLELEAVEVIPAGKRRLLRVVVDGDGPQGTGPLLDDIAEASKVASAALDKADVAGTAAYTFEMTSRGVGRPLELPRHWRRNAGRLVTVRLAEGDTITGRIVSNTEEGVRLDVDGEDPVPLLPGDIKESSGGRDAGVVHQGPHRRHRCVKRGQSGLH